MQTEFVHFDRYPNLKSSSNVKSNRSDEFTVKRIIFDWIDKQYSIQIEYNDKSLFELTYFTWDFGKQDFQEHNYKQSSNELFRKRKKITRLELLEMNFLSFFHLDK